MAQEPNLVSRSGSSNVSRRVKLAQVMTPTWYQEVSQEVSHVISRSISRRVKKWLKKWLKKNQEVAQVRRQEYGADPI